MRQTKALWPVTPPATIPSSSSHMVTLCGSTPYPSAIVDRVRQLAQASTEAQEIRPM